MSKQMISFDRDDVFDVTCLCVFNELLDLNNEKYNDPPSNWGPITPEYFGVILDIFSDLIIPYLNQYPEESDENILHLLNVIGRIEARIKDWKVSQL